MVSLINKQLLLTAYAYLFIMEQQKVQQGSEALQLQGETIGNRNKPQTGGRGCEPQDCGNGCQCAANQEQPEQPESKACSNCTYLNLADANECEMCQGTEFGEKKKCPVCTLLNALNEAKCTACGTDLPENAGSPPKKQKQQMNAKYMALGTPPVSKLQKKIGSPQKERDSHWKPNYESLLERLRGVLDDAVRSGTEEKKKLARAQRVLLGEVPFSQSGSSQRDFWEAMHGKYLDSDKESPEGKLASWLAAETKSPLGRPRPRARIA